MKNKIQFAKNKATSIFSSKPNGREKSFMESIYWGVGAKVYADIKDCKASGIKISSTRKSKSGAWYYLNKTEAIRLILYLITSN